jgi:signal peptidase II
MQNNKLSIALLLIIIVLLIDQSVKIWIKTNMMIGEEIFIFDWFKLHFVENEGMAFGLSLGNSYGKLALTLFRLVAVVIIGYLLRRLSREPNSMGLMLSAALIMAGALGNIIDSVFYGILFSDSDGQVATFLPESGGYAPLLYGKVVDMLWFPIYDGFLPHSLPIWGGTYFSFFRPVFNIADAAITAGVGIILLFQRRFFSEQTPAPAHHSPTPTPIDPDHTNDDNNGEANAQ